VRILHIDPDDIDNPLAGGGPERTYQVYRRLAARHEITVLTPTFPGSEAVTVRDGIRFVRLGRKVGNHGSSHHITFFFALPAAVRSHPHDLLVEDFMPPASVTLNPLFTRRPVIASVQWFFAEALSRQYHLPFFLGERYGLRLYRNFIVQTTAMRRLVESRRPGSRCALIPLGVDETLFALPMSRGEHVLYVGRVDTRQKGVDLLLRAYARIAPEERIPLVLAGHGFEWEAVRALLGELGLEQWVVLAGRVDAAQRAELLARSRFVCCPSREETFGLVILEACAAGRAVVLFDREPMNEVAPPLGCVAVPAYEVDAYAEAMRRLILADADELGRRGTICRRWAQRFRWNTVAERQEEFYQQVLDESA
jgi:glycosyltransferase involved in cell wall biosynthesis